MFINQFVQDKQGLRIALMVDQLIGFSILDPVPLIGVFSFFHIVIEAVEGRGNARFVFDVLLS